MENGLVNNTGIMNTPKGKTRDGFEMQIGTNHFGHFLLTELLLPILKNSTPSRIAILSSCYHDKAMGREGKIDFEDLNFEKRKYDGWTSYAQAKLANLLHAKQLAKHSEGTNVTVASIHPDWVRTNLIKATMPTWFQDVLLKPILRAVGMLEPWEGAQSTLYVLLSPEVEKLSGSYFSQTGIYRSRSANKGGWLLNSPNPVAHDNLVAEKLYQVSLEAVGLKNRKKAKKSLVRTHRRIANMRQDEHYKLARKVLEFSDVVVIEDLNLQGMKKLWGRKVSDLGLYQFVRILENKAEENAKFGNKRVHKIGRWFPSSKMCSKCFAIKKELGLHERIFVCDCGNKMSREKNAAINIKNEGASSLGLGGVRPDSVLAPAA